jgi:hypothetical protein
MRDVDNRRIRRNVENDALHGADEMIVGPEIGGQRNNRTMRQRFPLEDEILGTAKVIGGEPGGQGT